MSRAALLSSLRALGFDAVATPAEGARLIERLAAQDLRRPEIWGNAFGLEVWEDGEWCEWYDDLGRDVGELADALSERT